MNSKNLCPQCGKVQVMKVVTRKETYTYRGKPVTAAHELSICTVCGEEISTAVQAQKSLTDIKEAAHNTTDRG